jgi:hypothetical protein
MYFVFRFPLSAVHGVLRTQKVGLRGSPGVSSMTRFHVSGRGWGSDREPRAVCGVLSPCLSMRGLLVRSPEAKRERGFRGGHGQALR